MLKTLNRKIEQLNEEEIAAVKIPAPTKKDLEWTQLTGTIMTGIFLPLGIMRSSKLFIALGLLSLVSTGVSRYEKKRI
ncbi:hypothetical protein IGI39_000360 [Enterococcus sp. AZ135]|uniref:hypothetical protein n=1 Tax=unclassified Enterococcus TaxID=2608891 RepID=UPI003F1ECCC5